MKIIVTIGRLIIIGREVKEGGVEGQGRGLVRDGSQKIIVKGADGGGLSARVRKEKEEMSPPL